MLVDPTGMIGEDPPGKTWTSRAWDTIKGWFSRPNKGVVYTELEYVGMQTDSNDLESSNFEEPDWLNMESIGISLGAGIKNIKLAQNNSLKLSGSIIDYEYDFNNENSSISILNVGAGIENSSFSASLEGEVYNTDFISHSAGNGKAKFGYGDNYLVNGIGSIYDSDKGFFTGDRNSKGIPLNRLYYEPNNPNTAVPMNILTVDVKLLVKLKFEINLDMLILGPEYMKTDGQSWKKD